MPALRFPYPPPPIVRRSASAPVSKDGSNSGGGGVAWRAFDVAQQHPDLAGNSSKPSGGATPSSADGVWDDGFQGLLLPVPRTVKGR